MRDARAANGTETMTTTRRFDTLAAAFLFSSTEGGLIFGYGGWPNAYPADYYVVRFENVEWAEKVGMILFDNYEVLM